MADDQFATLMSIWEASRVAGRDVPPETLCLEHPELLPRVAAAVAARARHPERVGEFRVISLLGEGGMGAVYLAEDERLGRKAAVKVMRPDIAARPGTRERFLREARAAAAVEHDYIVPVWQVGESAGAPFIAMPLLQGESLEDRLKRQPVQPLAVVLKVAREVAEGLAAAHAKGLIHRDIKPANVWVEGDPKAADLSKQVRRCKLLDFGLARVTAGDDLALTANGMILGTPSYMAPEQAEGESVDARADLFSLGVMLYRMTTGELPFRGTTTMAVLASLLTVTPPPSRERNPQVPPALSDLITRLTAKKPAGRPASAEAVAAEVRRIVRELQATRPATAAPAVATTAPAAQPEETWADLNALSPARVPAAAKPPAKRGGNRGTIAAAVLGILAVVVAAGFVVVKVTSPDGKVTTVEVPEGSKVRVDPKGAVAVELPKETAAVQPAQVAPVAVGPPPDALADPDRRAAEALLPFCDVTVRLAGSGRDVWLRRNSPPPTEPFRVVVVFVAPNPNPPPGFTRDTLAAAVADLHHLERLASPFGWAFRCPEEELARLTAAPFAPRLVEFSLHPVLNRRTAELLRRFPKLAVLTVLGHELDDAALAGLSDLPNLEELRIRERGRATAVSEQGWAALAALPLKKLEVFRRDVDAAAARRFAGMGRLASLSLGESRVAEDAVAELAKAPRLEHLDLGRCPLTDAGLRHLHAAAPLRSLRLSDITGVSEAAVAALSAARPGCEVEFGGAKWKAGAKVGAAAPAEDNRATDALPPAAGATVDLLALVDPVKDAAHGGWKKDAAGLSGRRPPMQGEPPARLDVPYRPPAEYDLTAEFTPPPIDGDCAFKFTWDGRPLGWHFRVNAGRMGFQSIRNKSVLTRGWTGAADLDRAVSGRQVVTVRVRQDGVTAVWNGTAVTEWRGAPADVTPPSDTPTEISVSNKDDRTVVHRLSVTEVSGRGTLTRPPAAAPNPPPAEKASAFPPLDPAWVAKVQAMPPAEQAKAVGEELTRRNPGFDGRIEYQLNGDGAVSSFGVLTDVVADITPVQVLRPRYLNLNASDNARGRLADLSPLRAMQTAELDLFINRTRVADLSPLKELKLTLLQAIETEVSDLSPLKGMPLWGLVVTSSRLTDLSSLRGMKLGYVTLGGPVQDFSVLKGMSLQQLDLRQGTKLQDPALIRGMPLKTFTAPEIPTRLADELRLIKSLETINGKPAADFWREYDAQQPAP